MIQTAPQIDRVLSNQHLLLILGGIAITLYAFERVFKIFQTRYKRGTNGNPQHFALSKEHKEVEAKLADHDTKIVKIEADLTNITGNLESALERNDFAHDKIFGKLDIIMDRLQK